MLHQLSSNEALTLERYAMLEGALQSHSAFVVEMPKFHAQGLTLDAVPAFMGLGVEEMFRDTMDLQPMFVADPNVPPPGIAKIVHKAVVIVDEEKTEAAAVTAVLAPSAGALPSKPTEPFRFLADRPFYYLIEDLNPKTSEQTILFVGRMDEPPVWSE